MTNRLFSFIVPVYNRPDDVRDLLQGLSQQTYTHFEVLIIENGSTVSSEAVVQEYTDRLDIHYHLYENNGQGFARNFGVTQARGDYLIFLDSDTLIPPDYLANVQKHLEEEYLDAFGGPDRAHPSFTPVQKAIDYAMTSWLTTGGIRGKPKPAGKYYPRSFNMGFSPEVYRATGGFAWPNSGEDIELSIRVQQAGFKVRLIPQAFVYHKRRRTLAGFWQQMVSFGRSRMNLYRLYPESLEIIHLMPLGFYGYALLLPFALFLLPPLAMLMLPLLGVYLLAVGASAALQHRSLRVGGLSIATTLIVFAGYGYGLIKTFLRKKTP